MSLNEILEQYKTDEGMSDLFIQLFVESDNKFNFTEFNRIHETKFTHKQILQGLQEFTGSKVVKYCTPEYNDNLFSLFCHDYVFGKYSSARDWNLHLFNMTGQVLPRSVILSWIAKQRPEKSKSTFLPGNDGNLYAKDERVSGPAE